MEHGLVEGRPTIPAVHMSATLRAHVRIHVGQSEVCKEMEMLCLWQMVK